MEVRPKLARSAVLAAAFVALAVLGLFVRLQEYGPESALRKFHQAISLGSLRALQRVTVEDVRRPDVRAFVYREAHGGNRFRILRTDRTQDQARVAVAYSLPGGRTTYRVWVVDRKDRTWRVNAESSARVLYDALGLR